MLLSIVVPVYKEEKNIAEFLRRIRPILSGITEDYEIIFSLDPSPSSSRSIPRPTAPKT
jgi:polyisoprenyl-phosphate glycosyltransferase